MQNSQRLHLLFIQLLFTGHSSKVKVGVAPRHGGNRLKALGLQGARQHLLGKPTAVRHVQITLSHRRAQTVQDIYGRNGVT